MCSRLRRYRGNRSGARAAGIVDRCGSQHGGRIRLSENVTERRIATVDIPY